MTGTIPRVVNIPLRPSCLDSGFFFFFFLGLFLLFIYFLHEVKVYIAPYVLGKLRAF